METINEKCCEAVTNEVCSGKPAPLNVNVYYGRSSCCSIGSNSTSDGGSGTYDHDQLENKNLGIQHDASAIGFADGETFQEKYDKGELTGPQGELGLKGEKGDTGSTGLSAYEIAVSNGFSGSASEWLESLKNVGIVGGNIGEIFWWTMITPPDDSLFCDGRSVSREQYKDLFDVIGSSFGLEDEDSFNLPDLRGEFIRGYDPENIRDLNGSTRGIGKHQEGTQIPNVGLHSQGTSINITGQGNNYVNNVDAWIQPNAGMRSVALGSLATHASSLRYMPRPTNVNFLPCIRYKTIVSSLQDKVASLEQTVQDIKTLIEN